MGHEQKTPIQHTRVRSLRVCCGLYHGYVQFQANLTAQPLEIRPHSKQSGGVLKFSIFRDFIVPSISVRPDSTFKTCPGWIRSIRGFDNLYRATLLAFPDSVATRWRCSHKLAPPGDEHVPEALVGYRDTGGITQNLAGHILNCSFSHNSVAGYIKKMKNE